MATCFFFVFHFLVIIVLLNILLAILVRGAISAKPRTARSERFTCAVGLRLHGKQAGEGVGAFRTVVEMFCRENQQASRL